MAQPMSVQVPADQHAPPAEVAYPPIGNAGTTGTFRYSRAKLRLGFYTFTMLAELAALAAVQALAGVDPALGSAQLMLFGLIAPLIQAYGLPALEQPGAGVQRGALAAASASVVAALLAEAFGREAGSPALVAALALALGAAVATVRFLAVPLLDWLLPRRTNDLVLVDNPARQQAEASNVVDFTNLALDPDTISVDERNRLGHLFQHSDRILLDAAGERRAAWLALLQGADADIEIAGASEAIELRLHGRSPTQLLRRGGLPIEARVAKRTLDLVLTLGVLPLALPLMAGLALLIRLESPGPVLFRQWRVGRGNRQFVIFKFRTMRHGAVDALGHRSAEQADDRVTRIGRFLRRTSLDELPQLFNVLGGSMSLVGPRPHPLGCRAEDVLFWHVDPAYAQRHAVKPGMTGLAQVRGWRGATHRIFDVRNRLDSDLEYVATWSIRLDLLILVRTLGVLAHKNAY